MRSNDVRGAGLCVAALFVFLGFLPAASAARLEVDEPDVAVDVSRSLRGWETQSLELPVHPDESFDATVLIEGAEYVLELSRFSLRSEDFRLLVESQPGVYHEVSAPEPRTFRGKVRGLANDTVAATFVDGRLWATIDLGDHRGRWYVQPQAELTDRDVGDRHVTYRASDAIASSATCGVSGGEPLSAVRESAHAPAQPTAAAGTPPMQEVEIAIDTDQELYVHNGSRIDSTVYDVEALMNAVDLLYREQTGICYKVNVIVVRPGGDPFAPITADPTLVQFLTEIAAEWQNHDVASVPRGVVHMFSGQSQAGTIGRAFGPVNGAMCDDTVGYGLSLTHAEFLIQNRISLTAHELGHNWSACHCDQSCAHPDAPGNCASSTSCGVVSPVCGVMCSTIGACNGGATSFSTPSLSSIQEHRVSLQGVAGCLDPCLDGGDLGTASPIPADFGDAWVGDTGENVLAYPGIVSRFPSFYAHKSAVIFQHQHDHGTWLRANAIHDVVEHDTTGHGLTDLEFLTFYLGEIPPQSAFDSKQDPTAPENDGNPLIVVETLGPNPLATLLVYLSATIDHDPDQTLYLNVLLDQNTDGALDDGYDYVLNTSLVAWNREHWIKDYAFKMQPGLGKELALTGLRLERPTQSHWMRLIVSDSPVGQQFSPADFWDGTMPSTHFVFGEVEDFRLDYYPDASQLPTNGSRFGPGIVLKHKLENTPPPGHSKPACFLTLKKINYAAPFGIHQPFRAYVDLCPNQTAIGLSFGSVSVLGGCDPPADALIGLYGPTHRQGVMVPPTLVRAPGNAFPGGNAAVAMTCPPVVNLAPNHPDNGAPLWDNGMLPVQALRDGVRNWHVCYPCGPAGPPCRFRRYSFLVDVKTCGSEIENAALLVDQGPQEVNLPYGHLIERFEDPLEIPPRPFPDPDFTNYWTLLVDQFSIAGLDLSEFYSAPHSFRLVNATYAVEPTIPDEQVRTTQVGFRYLCEIQEAEFTATDGTSVTVFPPIVDCFTWQTFSYDLPPGFDLQSIAITGGDAYIDDVWTLLAPIEDPRDCNNNGDEDGQDIENGTSTDDNLDGVPDECEFDDCNGNGVPDSDDISSGTSTDCNGNGTPDECETDCDGNGEPDDCDLAGGATDCNGNGVLDECDTAFRTSPDADADGQPDECQDADTDGVSLAEDCDDASDQVWSTPGEVRDLLWTDPATLSWTQPSDPGGTSVVYDTLRAGEPFGFLFGATCVESDDGTDLQAIDATVPASGNVGYYLVRAENTCPDGAGSLGSDSSGDPRLGGGCP